MAVFLWQLLIINAEIVRFARKKITMETDKKVFQSEDTLVKLEVRCDEDMIWLTQKQMMELFQRDISVISRHVQNVFKEGELDKESNLHILQIANSDKPVAFYSLDVVISVGYRVKSKRGTEFRLWANQVLKDYILKGAAVNNRLETVERRVCYNEHKIAEIDQKVELMLQRSIPPTQGVFFNGQVFDAYQFVSDLIRSAQRSIVLFDNYANDQVLLQLTKRKENVSAKICVSRLNDSLRLDLQRHNAQYSQIEISEVPSVHDRFLLIDGTVLYTFGASFKDLGKKLFCFSKIESEEIVELLRR